MGKYTASDGKEFDTKREWRKYEMLLMYTFKEKTGETLPIKKPGDVNAEEFTSVGRLGTYSRHDCGSKTSGEHTLCECGAAH